MCNKKVEGLLVENRILKQNNEELHFMLDVLKKKVASYEAEIKHLKSQLKIMEDSDTQHSSIGLNPKLIDTLCISIRNIKLGSRAYETMVALGCETLGDVVSYSESDFLSCRKCGKGTLKEITDMLEKYWLRLVWVTILLSVGI